eukprot:SAG22_NODE_10285_length_543_cov_1.159910_1_plen_106_part_01
MKTTALVLALALLLGSARGQTCSLEDIECMSAPRVDTCTWPEWNGEAVVCEQSGEGRDGCSNQDLGCSWNTEPSCDFEGRMVEASDCRACMEAQGEGGGDARIINC